MGQTLYFLVFIGLIGACVLGTLAWQPPKRRCPSCGKETAVQNRACHHCKYVFGKA